MKLRCRMADAAVSGAENSADAEGAPVPHGELRCPNVADGEAVGKGIFGIQNILRKARDPRLSRKRRHDRGICAHTRLLEQAACEGCTQDAFVYEVLT